MSSRIKGVAMIIAKYHPELGGAERQAKLLSRYLMQMGLQVHVFTRNYHHGPRKEVIDGVVVTRSPVLGKGRVLPSLAFLFFTLWHLWRKRKHYEVIHCHQTYSPTTVGVLAGWLLRKPVIVKVTASNEYGEVKELRRLPFFRIRLYLLRRVKKFLVVNPTVIEELKTLNINPARALWIPNGVELPEPCALDLTARKRAREQVGISDDQKVLVFSGRLSAEKGLFEIVRAWGEVVKKFPKGKLFIVGEGGSQRNVELELKEFVAGNKLSHTIEFTGRVDTVLPYLMSADAFVLPSVSEGMSNSLLEAMACGVPCIATDIPATRAVMDQDEEGMTVPVGDANALANAIETLFKDRVLAMKYAKNAREKVRKLCSMDRISEKIVTLYEDSIQS